MICPRCGNEVSQEEVFCGQCGTPNTPPAKPTALPNTHSLSGGQPNTYNPPAPFTPAQPNANTFNPGTNYTQRTDMPSSHAPYAPDQTSMRPSAPNQQTGFYQDATEAITSLPGRPGPAGQGYPTGYLQQDGYAGSRQPGPQMQPFQAGNYRNAVQSPPFPARQGYPYGNRGGATPPPRQPNNQAVLVISICVVVVLVSIIGIAALLIVKSQQAAQANLAATPSVVATAIPSPTATPSPTPSPTPTAPPVTPTPLPDAGFTWCSTVCVPYSFSTEYPTGWQAGAASTGAGVMFTNPAQGDIYASIKAPGATTGSANDLITSDLQTNYAGKPNYTPPANTSTATISGETWLAEVAYYQTDTQRERVVVYATVHQGKAYIIELEAPDTQFDSINAQYFGNILTKFQFVQATS